MFGSGGSKRRYMMLQGLKTLSASTKPVELLAAENSLQEMETWMSKHLGNPNPTKADKKLYAKMYDYHMNLSKMRKLLKRWRL